ncbi:MAG: hypothetical protein M3Z41_04065, partial [Candidatus Eremiobacteraeota bacterium]|nr:hypothetical protein [Candidatus Eremiobacteraeota bacterium]
MKTPLATPTPTAVTVTEYKLPSANTYLGAITSGSDGNLWVTECDANKIGRVTLTGTITEFTIPTANTCPQIINPGPDGNLWFSETNFNKIGRITTAGVITEFPLPPPLGTGPLNPTGIVAGPDGNIWFSHPGASVVGVMSIFGTLIASYSTPTVNAGPDLIIAGRDGNMWFAEATGPTNFIAKSTMSGTITEFAVPTQSSNGTGGTIGGIAWGQDGNIWFTEKVVDKIGRVTPSGVMTEWAYATGTFRFMRMTTTSDGYLWIAEAGFAAPWTSEIAKMNTLGTIVAEYAIPGPASCPTAPIYCGIRGMTVGPDNNVWFTDEGND